METTSDLDGDQFNEQRIKAKGIDLTYTTAIKYILDRKQYKAAIRKIKCEELYTANSVSSIRQRSSSSDPLLGIMLSALRRIVEAV